MHAQIASSLVLHRQGESPLMVADSYLVDREAKAATPATISTFAIVYSTILVERSMVFYKRGNLGTARTCVCMYHTYAGLLGVKCEELVSSRYSVVLCSRLPTLLIDARANTFLSIVQLPMRLRAVQLTSKRYGGELEGNR